MFRIACEGILAVKALHYKIRSWVLGLVPHLIMSYHCMGVLATLMNYRLVSVEKAVVLDVADVFGYIYTAFDALLTSAAVAQILVRGKEETGVTMLLIGRVIHRLLFTMWVHVYHSLLNDCLDVSSLLVLLATRVYLRDRNEWPRLALKKCEFLLLAGRIGLSSIYISWLEEIINPISSSLSLALLSALVLGIKCRAAAYLTALVIPYHDVLSPHFWFLWGWNDALLSLEHLSLLLCKIGGFLLLSQLGAGKWSLDRYLSRAPETKEQMGHYRHTKTKTSAYVL
ncbi:uncharacterized protein [Drosophila pseudoobscura]|uniref:Uncharacterized protein n=1 Tax=Drosophila pseudoobscura pseudoobscura TaxID=46245 RepID=A0A6I8UAA8_DROPS|nr:uncharacterized protein LOC4811730 [Drosophila pseudoobscura]